MVKVKHIRNKQKCKIVEKLYTVVESFYHNEVMLYIFVDKYTNKDMMSV